jgi:hypothetical protein
VANWLPAGSVAAKAVLDALWEARGAWADLIVLLLVWRLTLHTREIARYVRARRLRLEQRHLQGIAAGLESRLDSGADGGGEHAALERRLARAHRRLRKLDRVLGASSLDRPE